MAKRTSYLFRTLGREIVQYWRSDTEGTMIDQIKSQSTDWDILCVLCHISRQLDNINKALNAKKGGE